MNAPSKCMSENEQKLAKQCIECGITPTSIAHLLTCRNESGYYIDWNPGQIYRLQVKENILKGLSPNATSAENLVKSFDNRDDVDYLYVTFHPLDGLMFVKGKKNLKRFVIMIKQRMRIQHCNGKQ